MYRKLKNVLSGLAMAAVALVGGAMFGEPAQPRNLDVPAPVLAIELAPDPVVVDLPDMWIQVREDGVRIHIATPAPAVQRPQVPRRHAAFQMPYFSFGATLPRASLPSES